MDKNTFACTHLREVMQGVVSREKGDRDRHCLFKTQICGLADNKGRQRPCIRPEAPRGNSDHFITYSNIFHSLTNRHNPAGALIAEHHVIIAVRRIETQGLHDIAKVQCSGTELNLDLSRVDLLTFCCAQG